MLRKKSYVVVVVVVVLVDLRNAVWELRSKAEEIAELKQINELLSSENKEKVLVLKSQ